MWLSNWCFALKEEWIQLLRIEFTKLPWILQWLSRFGDRRVFDCAVFWVLFFSPPASSLDQNLWCSICGQLETGHSGSGIASSALCTSWILPTCRALSIGKRLRALRQEWFGNTFIVMRVLGCIMNLDYPQANGSVVLTWTFFFVVSFSVSWRAHWNFSDMSLIIGALWQSLRYLQSRIPPVTPKPMATQHWRKSKCTKQDHPYK